MRFVVLFEDNPERAAARAQLMPDHLAFLGRHASSMLAAGPLADAGDGAAAGGMWLVEAPDHDAVRTLIETDPFWPTGLRRSVRILRWNRVFADGQRLI